jgi:hypothetical protein
MQSWSRWSSVVGVVVVAGGRDRGGRDYCSGRAAVVEVVVEVVVVAVVAMAAVPWCPVSFFSHNFGIENSFWTQETVIYKATDKMRAGKTLLREEINNLFKGSPEVINAVEFI